MRANARAQGEHSFLLTLLWGLLLTQLWGTLRHVAFARFSLYRPHVPQECHCMLFLTPEDDFVGEAQTVSLDELVELTKDL